MSLKDRLEELSALVQAFADARDWAQFHDAKNLTMALSAEVGELSEILRWVRNEDVDAAIRNATTRSSLQDEIADITILLLLLCNRVGVDLDSAVRAKLQKNALKYPADRPGNPDPIVSTPVLGRQDGPAVLGREEAVATGGPLVGRASDLPPSGRVLGVDVGFSDTTRSTCFCLLTWTPTEVSLHFKETTADESQRRAAISALCQGHKLLSVAIDGPLAAGLEIVTTYRSAEALLSRGVMQKRGKPGQTSVPAGQKLHHHATALAHLVLELTSVEIATHADAIHDSRVVEAFPNAFLAALIDDHDFSGVRRDASDVFWGKTIREGGRMHALVRHLLGDRAVSPRLETVTDHEHRAGVICALTALGVAAGDFVAVGDPVCGQIILPPLSLWGSNASDRSWLHDLLTEACESVRRDGRWPGFDQARVVVANTSPVTLPE